jgi:hypothetical protein
MAIFKRFINFQKMLGYHVLETFWEPTMGATEMFITISFTHDGQIFANLDRERG